MSIDRETSNFLELPADLITEDPELFKQWLLAALAAQRPTILSGKAVARLGTAALQLLVAFYRECQARSIQCELRDASPALAETLACVGLDRELGLTA